MKKKISPIISALLLVFGVVYSSNIAAQNREVEPEIKHYIAEKGEKAGVPTDITNLVRGDLNGDGKEDVVIQYYIQIGYPGNMTDTYLAAFLNKNGKMEFAAEIADIKVVPAKIENKMLICDKYGDGSKEFEKVGTVKYKLVKQKLVEVKPKNKK